MAADGTQPAWRPGSFDRVLADVPCSGLGALRRRAEARWRKSPADVAALGLACSAPCWPRRWTSARPGGVVGLRHLLAACRRDPRRAWPTCSAARDDVEVLDAPAVLPEVPGLRCPEPGGRYAQFWPHRHGTDAIFLALLRRTD